MSKVIDCPDCIKPAILFVDGEPNAGIWECPHCGASDICDHQNVEVEQVAAAYDPTREEPAYVCQDCGIITADDPREAAHDAHIDAQVAEAREVAR